MRLTYLRDDVDDDPPPEPFRISILLVGVVAVVAALLGGFYGAAAVGMGYCGGDGGSPYAERGSARLHLCGRAEDKLALLEFPGAPMIAGVATVVACTRQRFAPLLIGIGLAALALIAPLTTLAHANPKCVERDAFTTDCSHPF